MSEILRAYIGYIWMRFNVYPDQYGNLNEPIVLKMDGLMNGKGVMVCENIKMINDFIIMAHGNS